MKEISFLNVLSKDNSHCTYLTAIYAIEVLRCIQPAHVDEYIGYMYAVDNNDKLALTSASSWNAYASKNHKSIEVDTIFKSLELINKLVEPFINKEADTSGAEFTIPLPKEIARTILNEDLTDPNVMNTLELSVRNLNASAVDSINNTREDRVGYIQIAFDKVLDCFKPLLDKCKFSNSISEEKLRKDFSALVLHQYAIWLSCLYRLFYHYEKDYWDSFDDIIGGYGDSTFRNPLMNPYISKALQVPVAVPETVVGITTAKKYIEPPLLTNRSSYLSLSERYLTLVYWQLLA